MTHKQRTSLKPPSVHAYRHKASTCGSKSANLEGLPSTCVEGSGRKCGRKGQGKKYNKYNNIYIYIFLFYPLLSTFHGGVPQNKFVIVSRYYAVILCYRAREWKEPFRKTLKYISSLDAPPPCSLIPVSTTARPRGGHAHDAGPPGCLLFGGRHMTRSRKCHGR